MKYKKDNPRRALASDSYRTDKWILGIFEDWFDPCPYNPNWSENCVDGLKIDWVDKTFVNPPYSNPKPWVQKAILTHNLFGGRIAMLLKHDSSTEWYRLIHESGAKILLVNGRLKHQTTNSCAFPSMIAVWGELE